MGKREYAGFSVENVDVIAIDHRRAGSIAVTFANSWRFGEFGLNTLLPENLAFAIQASEEESSEVLRRTGALKELYEAARKRGALGTTTIAEAFAAAVDGEVRK